MKFMLKSVLWAALLWALMILIPLIYITGSFFWWALTWEPTP